MDPSRLKPQARYFKTYFGVLQILTYTGQNYLHSLDASFPGYIFLVHERVCLRGHPKGAAYVRSGTQYLSEEQVEHEVHELSKPFREFISLFQ